MKNMDVQVVRSSGTIGKKPIR